MVALRSILRNRSLVTCPYGFQKGTGCPIVTSPLLNVGQKITKADITCVVGADRPTACIDPILKRGFVLQRSGLWTF